MTKIIIIVLTIVFALTFIMFFLLKKIVNTINEQSKVFFMMKLQSYDELIEEKEEELKKIKEEVKIEKEINKEVPKEKISVVIQDNNPKYEIEGLLEVIKKIDSEFNYDINQIIKQFVDISNKYSIDYYTKLLNIKDKIKEYGLFNIVTKTENEQLEIIKNLKLDDNNLMEIYNFNYKKFDINDFLKILNIEIQKNDPTIFVYVGNNYENYDKLGNNVKTCFDKTILKGVRIKYHNIIYEYSLSY